MGKGTYENIIKDLMLDERLILFAEGGKMLPPPKSMLSTNFSCEQKSSSVKEVY